MYGVVTINGKNYVQRPEVIPYQQTMKGTLDIATPRLIFPGVADFLILALTRDVTITSANTSAPKRFKFRFGNSDGNTWYSESPNNVGASNRVLDSLIFGVPEFPFQLPAPIIFGANASMMMEFEDVTNASQAYTIYIGYVGAWLIPASS